MDPRSGAAAGATALDRRGELDRLRAVWSDARVAVAIGGASALLVVIGSWIPSLWGDEAASIMSARREWDSLWALLGRVDAVHGLYFALLHVWIDLVGASAFAVRLPSAIAIGVASAGLYLLVRSRAERGVALVAAVVFTVLPRVAYVATEARSMALATAAAVWLSLLMMRLLDGRAGRAWWWVYACGLAVASYLFLYLALLGPVHAVVVAVALFEQRRGPARMPRIRPFLLAWTGAAVLSMPIGVIAVLQRDQIAFRGRQRVVTVESVVVAPWFILWPVALVGWALIATAVGAVVANRRDATWQGRRSLLVLSGAWILVPAAVLLLITAFVTPTYTPRYLVFCAPAAAIAIAIGISALRGRWLQGIAVAVIAGLALPAFVDQRTPYAKNGGTDWQTLSAVVAEVSRPGDGIVFDDGVRPSRRPRLAMYTYPEGFAGLVDLGLVRRHDETDRLWDVTAPLAEVDHRLSGVERVVVVSRSEHGVDADIATLRSAGFTQVQRTALASDVVLVYVRDGGLRDDR